MTDSNFSLERNGAITRYVVRVNSHVSVYICIFVYLPDGYWKSCARHPVAQITPDGRKCLLDCASFASRNSYPVTFVLPVAVFVCLSLSLALS